MTATHGLAVSPCMKFVSFPGRSACAEILGLLEHNVALPLFVACLRSAMTSCRCIISFCSCSCPIETSLKHQKLHNLQPATESGHGAGLDSPRTLSLLQHTGRAKPYTTVAKASTRVGPCKSPSSGSQCLKLQTESPTKHTLLRIPPRPT